MLLRLFVLIVFVLGVTRAQVRADGVVVASTRDTPQSLALEATRRIEGQGYLIVAANALGEPLASSRKHAVQVVGGLFLKAREHYVAERYDEAIAMLRAQEGLSLRLLLETQSGRAVLVQLNLWLGCLYLAAENVDAAADRFRLAVSLEPSSTLDEVLWPPEYVGAFHKAIALGRAQGQVVLRASSAAAVQLDGQAIHVLETEVSRMLPAGLHYLFVHAPGSARFATQFSVQPASVVTLETEESSASAAEVEYDLMNMRPEWLGASPTWRRALMRLVHATRMAVVRNTGTLFYDQQGLRIVTLEQVSGADSGVPSATPKKASTRAPLYTRWWLWTGVVAVVGGSVALWATSRDGETVRGEFVR